MLGDGLVHPLTPSLLHSFTPSLPATSSHREEENPKNKKIKKNKNNRKSNNPSSVPTRLTGKRRTQKPLGGLPKNHPH
jgi:hypothetical protein